MVVNVPDQSRLVHVERRDISVGIPDQPVPGVFWPFRLVINLEVIDDAQPNLPGMVFKPPIEVRVKFNADDLEIAKARDQELRLGYWDGKQWKYFTAKHAFHLEYDADPAAGGWGVVKVSNWADPTHAWGT